MLKEVQELAEKFKVEEDEQYISPYAHLEKAQGRSWHGSGGAVVTRLRSLEGQCRAAPWVFCVLPISRLSN